MATATELLANTASTDSKVLVIDHYRRMINIPTTITCLGVENDDEVLRLNFRMPRYLDKTDLSKFVVRINYLNARGEDDVYDVDDLAIVGDNLTFTWLVGPTATRYKGPTKFNVCMRIVDPESYVEKEYNTTIATLPVLEGLECDEGVVERYSDILEQWKNQLFGIGDTEEAKLTAKSNEEQQNIANKGREVLDTIPEDYTTTYNLANEASRLKGAAIVGSAEGEVININDSSDDYIRDLKLYGKSTQISTTGQQLFDHTAIAPNLYTTIAPDGTITVECDNSAGQSGKFATFYTPPSSLLKPSVEYSIVLEVFSTSGVGEAVYLASQHSDELSQFVDTPSITSLSVGTYKKRAVTRDSFQDCIFMCRGFMSIPAGAKVKSVFRVTVAKGLFDSQRPFVYETFSGGFPSPSPDWPQKIDSFQDTTIYVGGKNLLNITTGGTAVGVVETVQNGLVSFSGTGNGSGGRTLWKRSDVVTLLPGTYTFTMKVKSGTAPQHCLTRNDTTAVVANGDSTFTVSEPTPVYLGFNYISGTVYNAKNVSVQLERGNVATDHASYKPVENYNYTLPDKFYAGELNCLTGILRYAKLTNLPVSGWSPGKLASGWIHGADSVDGDTIPFHYHIGAENENFPSTLCTHFPAAKTWAEIVSGKTEMAYQGNTSGLAFIAIRIKRSRLVEFGFLNNKDIDNAKNAFEAWLYAMDNLNAPVKIVGKMNKIGPIDPIEVKTNATDTVIYNNCNAPMSVKYNCDTKTYIDNAIKSSIAEMMVELERKYGG